MNCLLCIRELVISAHNDIDGTWEFSRCFFEKIQAVHDGHLDIYENNGGFKLIHGTERFLTIFNLNRLFQMIFPPLPQFTDSNSDRTLVISDKCFHQFFPPFCRSGSSPCTAGIVNVTSV